MIIWSVILILGFLFALIFAKLSILYKGEGGVSLATKQSLGKKYQLLSSFYLICAVIFGPVAVLLIAAEFIQEFFPTINLVYLSFFIYVITYILLLTKITFLGKLMLIVSSTISFIFLIASIFILLQVENFSFSLPNIQTKEVGYSFLIIFWSIVGWEVIGNYSNEIKNDKTMTYAVLISAIIISSIYILIAFAICFGEFNQGSFKLIYLITPIFSSFSTILLSSISLVLCIGTLILFVGSVSRLMSSLNLTKYTSMKNKNGIAIGALNILSLSYILLLILVYLSYLNLNNLVAFADGFFIANAIIGLMTAIKIFKNGFLRVASIILCFVFIAILLFSNIFILLLIFALFLFTYLRNTKIT